MTNFDVLVGQSVVGISYSSYSDRADLGLNYLDIATAETGSYRFATEIIEGERTEGGWSAEHFSLIVEPNAVSSARDTQGHLAGVIRKVDRILADEWLGPVDISLQTHGSNPRSLFDGKVGSRESGVQYTTVTRGVLLHSEEWVLLVRTHSFPRNIDITTDLKEIRQFTDYYDSLDFRPRASASSADVNA